MLQYRADSYKIPHLHKAVAVVRYPENLIIKMKAYILLFLCLLPGVSDAQNPESLNMVKSEVDFTVDKFVDSLQKNNIKNIITVARNIEGGFPDSLGFPISRYILWEIKSKVYIITITGYTDNGVIKGKAKLVEDCQVFSFIKANDSVLRNEYVLPFVRKLVVNKIELYEVNYGGLHNAMNFITVYSNDIVFQKAILQSDLKESYGANLVNLNFKYNESTKLVNLWKMLWELILKENR